MQASTTKEAKEAAGLPTAKRSCDKAAICGTPFHIDLQQILSSVEFR
jgi:hypothetical protein